jgi:hypothetical protein
MLVTYAVLRRRPAHALALECCRRIPNTVTGCAALALFVSLEKRLGAKVKPRPSLEGDLVSSQPHLVFRTGIQQSDVVKARSEADQCRAGGLLLESLGLSR